MTVQISAFSWVPKGARGFVKDLRVRWALEECAIAYEEELIRPLGECPDAYRQWQPFGQVPAYRDDQVEMFESGAIVLHIARDNPALSPPDRSGQARMEAWVFAALSTIEPRFQTLFLIDDALVATPEGAAFRQRMVELLDKRLREFSSWFGGREYLVDRFTAADIIMATVLRDIRGHDFLTPYPELTAYLERCEARPAFTRALAAQMVHFSEDASA